MNFEKKFDFQWSLHPTVCPESALLLSNHLQCNAKGRIPSVYLLYLAIHVVCVNLNSSFSCSIYDFMMLSLIFMDVFMCSNMPIFTIFLFCWAPSYYRFTLRNLLIAPSWGFLSVSIPKLLIHSLPKFLSYYYSGPCHECVTSPPFIHTSQEKYMWHK
jgi:hypothetical protein